MTRRLALLLSAFAIRAGLLVFEPPRTAQADTGTNWTGEYFNNPNLQGSPVFTRIDPAVVFNWGTLSPGPGIGSTNWSARWTTVQYLNAGTYRFTITADDGVRVYIDGQTILDAWHNQAATTYTVNVQVVAGNHAIQTDYYQDDGYSRLLVWWDYILATSTAWTAQYYNNPNLQGAPVLSRYESSINYLWGFGSPDPAVPPDNFSARWTGTFAFSAATYRFTLAGDDGVRLFIDNLPVIDQWHPQALVAYSIDVPLAAGQHTLRVEYFEGTSQATVRFDYAVAVGPPPYPGSQADQWYGEYFANPYLSGSPSFIRLDGQSGINFNWNSAPPVVGFPRDSFSVRWTRRVFFPGRPYTFYITVDDGARLYIDSILIIDSWHIQPATSITKNVDITEGFHFVRLEYFQDHFESLINMTWDPPNSKNPPQLRPGAAPLASGETGWVNTHALNVRTGPGVKFDILTAIPRGDTFNVIGRNADTSWLHVQHPQVTGWLSAFYIVLTSGNINTIPIEAPAPGLPSSSTGVRARLYSGLLLRTGPDVTFPAYTTFGWGTLVDVVGRNANNTWYQVQYGGNIGWIYAPYTAIVAGTLANVPITG